jgi:hypothetical protein
METLFSLLLNIVYGFLFFVAMGIFLLTGGVFVAATWQNVVRPLVRRNKEPQNPETI